MRSLHPKWGGGGGGGVKEELPNLTGYVSASKRKLAAALKVKKERCFWEAGIK